jgi:hypothetical protein
MLTENEARRIAAEWHGGQGSALYALASTGTVVAGASAEASACERQLRDGYDPGTGESIGQLLRDARGLVAYVESREPDEDGLPPLLDVRRSDGRGFMSGDPVTDADGAPVALGSMIDGGDGTIGVVIDWSDPDGDVDDDGRSIGINATVTIRWPDLGDERCSLSWPEWGEDDYRLHDWSVVACDRPKPLAGCALCGTEDTGRFSDGSPVCDDCRGDMDLVGAAGMTPMCEQRCGAVATVYAMDKNPGGWGGRYCEPCARALGFMVTDRLTNDSERSK